MDGWMNVDGWMDGRVDGWAAAACFNQWFASSFSMAPTFLGV